MVCLAASCVRLQIDETPECGNRFLLVCWTFGTVFRVALFRPRAERRTNHRGQESDLPKVPMPRL